MQSGYLGTIGFGLVEIVLSACTAEGSKVCFVVIGMGLVFVGFMLNFRIVWGFEG